MAEGQGTEAATRVADVLLLFTDGPDFLGVTAIARSLDLSKAVVHRILSTLLEKDYIQIEPATRRYALGPAALKLGLTYLDGIDGTVIGAISVCGPAHRVDAAARERFGPLVREAADRISRALGWSGGLPK